ncbi:MAG: hypothetical protein LBF93_00125 [Zoogloeaceae bacterium]|nr:hypothetical protein [Zoogloeaceae bacterium]
MSVGRARVLQRGGWALMGTTLAPAFRDSDYEAGDTPTLWLAHRDR